MKRIFSFLFLPALLISGCKAQPVPGNKSLLWRISGKGLSHPSYLFGTIHLLCQDDYVWTPAMKKSLAACKEVCFEMDMDDPEVLKEASSGMNAASNKPLSDYFTEDQYRKLSLFARDSLGLPLEQMQQIKPVMLQTLFMTKTVGCLLPVSYEANIMEAALQQKKEITGLEAVQEQLAVLQTLTDDSAVHGLMELVDSFSASKEAYRKMIHAYQAQDLPALYELICSSGEMGDDLGVFLDDRNARWIPRMSGKMNRRSVFFAVGAGHLWGDQGVIRLLRKEGYQVEAIR